MTSPAPLRAVVLPPMLAAPVWWYAAACHADIAAMDPDIRYDKRRKDFHRFTIASVHGPLAITIPVSKPQLSGTERQGRAMWRDMRISAHDRWWLNVAETLATAYGGTPWFHHLFPAFRDLFSEKAVGTPIPDFLVAMDTRIRSLLHLPTPFTTQLPDSPSSTYPLLTTHYSLTTRPYPQVRQASLGFLPGLSILDPLFNLGPRGTLTLLQST